MRACVHCRLVCMRACLCAFTHTHTHTHTHKHTHTQTHTRTRKPTHTPTPTPTPTHTHAARAPGASTKNSASSPSTSVRDRDLLFPLLDENRLTQERTRLQKMILGTGRTVCMRASMRAYVRRTFDASLMAARCVCISSSTISQAAIRDVHNAQRNTGDCTWHKRAGCTSGKRVGR